MRAWSVQKPCSGNCLRGRRNSRPFVCLPLPRQQFVQAGDGKIGDAGEHIGEAKRKATCQDAADVAEALVNIRTYFMPKRAKQKF